MSDVLRIEAPGTEMTGTGVPVVSECWIPHYFAAEDQDVLEFWTCKCKPLGCPEYAPALNRNPCPSVSGIRTERPTRWYRLGVFRIIGIVSALTFLSLSSWVHNAAAAEIAPVVQVPEAGIAVKATDRIICGPMAPGWALESDNQRVTPPRTIPEGASRQFSVRVSDTVEGCADSKQSITLVATAALPIIDSAQVMFYPAEGRLAVRGRNLQGLQILWRKKAAGNTTDATNRSVEVCLESTRVDNAELCTIPVSRDLSSDSEFTWFPAHATPDPESVLFDELGNRIAKDRLRLRPARVVLPARLWTKDGVDVSRGPGTIPLLFPEAITSVDCGSARCELVDGAVVIRSVPGPATMVALQLKLGPRVYVPGEGGALSQTVVARLPLMACPLRIISGPPLRETPVIRIVVRMDARCGSEAGRLQWTVGGEDAEVENIVTQKDDVFVLLRSEKITRTKVTVTAARGGVDPVVIGSATELTKVAPVPRASIELLDGVKVPFIPTNRDGSVIVSRPLDDARLVLLPLEGVYFVGMKGDRPTVRGDGNAGGFGSLQFGYRRPGLPGDLGNVDLAILSEALHRQVREASVPANFASAGGEADGLAEFLCTDLHGNPYRVLPGKSWTVPFAQRDTCRVVIHRERLKLEDGMQEVVLEVDVKSADGEPREAQVRERMVLRPGAEPRVFWVKGGIEQFDRITVRLTHVVDEERYLISAETRAGLPSVQWSAVIEGGRLRVYATAAIPAGLFRVNEPSGQLRLNFGVISRVTWLNEVGKEGLFGAELGLLGMGLVTSSNDLQDWPATLGMVMGVGLRVPLGQGAAIGVNAWMVYEFRDEVILNNGDKASHVSFVFGPSISVGNVGKNF